MEASSNRRGGSFYGGVAPYRSREGRSSRTVVSSDEIQLRIDPIHGDWDDEVIGPRSQVRWLKRESEAKYQNDFLETAQMAVMKAPAGVKNNLRKLNKVIIKKGGNHIGLVVLFAVICFLVVYLWSKMYRR